MNASALKSRDLGLETATLLTCKTVREMTDKVSSGTLNLYLLIDEPTAHEVWKEVFCWLLSRKSYRHRNRIKRGVAVTVSALSTFIRLQTSSETCMSL